MSEIRKLTGFIGAEIMEFNFNNPIGDPARAFLYNALNEYHVIVIRNQNLTLQQQKMVTSIFGDIMKLPYVTPLPHDSEVIAVLKEATEINTGVFGGDWHSDFSFLEHPPAGSVLNAIDIPSVGGDTIWVNQVAAYRSLPTHLREIVDTKRAVHVGAPYGVKHAPPESDQANTSIEMSRGDPNADKEMMHPAVITIPNTGERALFLNPIYTTRFENMSEAESKPLLEEIYKHCTRPDFAFRHRWQNGDLVVWNNRTTLHYATNDYDGERRLLYRTAFRRDTPT